MKRNADCPNAATECRITFTTSIQQPLIDWVPIYDGDGTQVNADPNVIVNTFTCATCAATWTEAVTFSAPPPPSDAGP